MGPLHPRPLPASACTHGPSAPQTSASSVQPQGLYLTPLFKVITAAVNLCCVLSPGEASETNETKNVCLHGTTLSWEKTDHRQNT